MKKNNLLFSKSEFRSDIPSSPKSQFQEITCNHHPSFSQWPIPNHKNCIRAVVGQQANQQSDITQPKPSHVHIPILAGISEVILEQCGRDMAFAKIML